MATQAGWPAVKHDYRKHGLSFRILRVPKLKDIVKVCDHYEEKMLTLCAKISTPGKLMTLKAIAAIRSIASRILSTETKVLAELDRTKDKLNQYEVLLAGDLEGDPTRTPQSMKTLLLELETQYVVKLDVIESLKRQIKMLEESI